MQGKEFTINRKSAVKKDKAIAKLDKLEIWLAEIIEKQKITQDQKDRVITLISKERRIIKDNT